MTTQIAEVAQTTPAGVGANAGRDVRALRVAKALRDACDVECVILFGSRARGDWTDHSDIDLMIIEPEVTKRERQADIQGAAWELARLAYQDYVDIDFVCLLRSTTTPAWPTASPTT